MDSTKPPQPPPTRCASSRPRETGRPWIRRRSCTWYFNWRIETLEMRVMRRVMRKVMGNMNWLVLALVAMTIMAMAQQPASAPQNPQAVSATQPGAAQAAPNQTNLARPATMDQAVDRVIAREKDLIKFLSPRTPIVETYLQDLAQDPQLGPIPQDDHYFLGRMDLSDSIEHSDYLQDKGKDKDEGMEKRLLGGLTKKFKFQYQPLGFSWMIFVDRNDFDRQHYDFHYARREFLGDVRCLVFDLTP